MGIKEQVGRQEKERRALNLDYYLQRGLSVHLLGTGGTPRSERQRKRVRAADLGWTLVVVPRMPLCLCPVYLSLNAEGRNTQKM